MIATGAAGFLLSLLLLWRLNNARGREDFRWYVVPQDEAEEAVPQEPIRAELEERATALRRRLEAPSPPDF